MKRTRSHIILSIVPLVALIGVFFGMGMYHIVRNSRATFKDAYAQEYEAMPAVMQRPMDVQSSGVVPDPLLSSSVAEGSVPDAVQSLARLKDYIAHLKEKSLSLEEKLSLVNQLLTLRNEEVDELKQSNSALDNRIRQLSGELEQKARQIGRFDEALRQRTEFLDEKVRLLNQLLSSRDEELRRLRTENTDLEANLDRLFEAHLKLKEDFDNNVGELSEELGRKRLEVTNLNVMKYVKFSLQSQISELSDKVADLNSVRVELENQLHRSRQEKAELENELSLAREELALQEKLSLEFKESIAGLKADLRKKASDIEKLRVPYRDLEVETGQLKVIKEEYEKRIGMLTRQLAEMNASEESSRESLLRLSALVTRNELEKEFVLQEKTEDVMAMERKLEETREENRSLLEIVETKDRTIQALKTKTVDTLREKISVLKGKMKGSLRERRKLKKELARTQALNRHLHRRMKKMHMELELRRNRAKGKEQREAAHVR